MVGRGNLEIRDLVSQDAGLYHCALTDAPDIFAEAMLNVIGEWKTSTDINILRGSVVKRLRCGGIFRKSVNI